jgi:hypothetical protein
VLNEKTTRVAAIVPVIQDLSAALGVGLVVVLFVSLVRWHILTRIERLRDQARIIVLGDDDG